MPSELRLVAARKYLCDATCGLGDLARADAAATRQEYYASKNVDEMLRLLGKHNEELLLACSWSATAQSYEKSVNMMKRDCTKALGEQLAMSCYPQLSCYPMFAW